MSDGNLAIYLEYGIPLEEAELHVMIDRVYVTKYRRLQETHGTFAVPSDLGFKLAEQSRRAHADLADQRQGERKVIEAREKREAARIAAGGSPADQPSAPHQPQHQPSQPQRPAGTAPAGAGTTSDSTRATLAPDQHSAGTVADVEAALAAFQGRPD